MTPPERRTPSAEGAADHVHRAATTTTRYTWYRPRRLAHHSGCYSSCSVSNTLPPCCMTLLHGTLEAHGVDIERLAWRAVSTYLTNRRSHLQAADREDLTAYVISELWRVSVTYDESRSGCGFSTYAYRLAGARITDWYRLRFGRTTWRFGDGTVHTRDRQQPLSLDAPDADGRAVVDALGDWSGHRAEDRAAVVDGLHAAGDRALDRDLFLLRAAAARRAPGRDRRAAPARRAR